MFKAPLRICFLKNSVGTPNNCVGLQSKRIKDISATFKAVQRLFLTAGNYKSVFPGYRNDTVAVHLYIILTEAF